MDLNDLDDDKPALEVAQWMTLRHTSGHEMHSGPGASTDGEFSLLDPTKPNPIRLKIHSINSGIGLPRKNAAIKFLRSEKSSDARMIEQFDTETALKLWVEAENLELGGRPIDCGSREDKMALLSKSSSYVRQIIDFAGDDENFLAPAKSPTSRAPATAKDSTSSAP